MAKQKLEVEVSKEAYELGLALFGIVKAVKDAAADGKIELAEVVAAVVAQVSPIVSAVQGIDQLDDEVKEDIAAFSKALALPLADIPGLFLAPKQEVVAPQA